MKSKFKSSNSFLIFLSSYTSTLTIESLAFSLVNSSSKLSKNESPSTFGLKGATSSLSNNFDQSKSSNQGWDNTSNESA